MKLYIREWTEESVDGEELAVCEVCESEIQPLSYIVFIEK